MSDEISIVIGSWGSYNECNERALGSNWLNLSQYNDWDEIVEELGREGFELDGIDEELFIQDIEGIPSNACDWDNVNPQELFELLYESDVIYDSYKYECFSAFLEVRSFSEFEDLVNRKGSNWTDEINLYKGYTWDEYGRMVFEECYNQNSVKGIENYIDFEDYGKDMGFDYVEEYSEGLIEIYY